MVFHNYREDVLSAATVALGAVCRGSLDSVCLLVRDGKDERGGMEVERKAPPKLEGLDLVAGLDAESLCSAAGTPPPPPHLAATTTTQIHGDKEEERGFGLKVPIPPSPTAHPQIYLCLQ